MMQETSSNKDEEGKEEACHEAASNDVQLCSTMSEQYMEYCTSTAETNSPNLAPLRDRAWIDR